MAEPLILARSATLRQMDRSGAMPSSAWFEVRAADGELLASVAADIRGGSVRAELPAYPPQTKGRIQLCTRERDGAVHRDEAGLEELPTEPVVLRVDIG